MRQRRCRPESPPRGTPRAAKTLQPSLLHYDLATVRAIVVLRHEVAVVVVGRTGAAPAATGAEVARTAGAAVLVLNRYLPLYTI